MPPAQAPSSFIAQDVLWHVSFYKFARVAEPEAVAALLREMTHRLLGSILVAGEGVNGMLAGSAAALDSVQSALTQDPRLNGLLAGMAFKRSACTTPPFQRMKVHLQREILPLGVSGVDAVNRTGPQVSPAAWRELIADENLVLIDNRNSFEVRLGRFRNAIDPQVDNFRDLPRFIRAYAPEWKSQGKRVAMYCTGGIRCEKTTAWMLDLGLQVQQLEGGILNYFAQMPDAEQDFIGECFVFDKRVALDTRLQETGTTAEDVYDAPGEAWRLQRARQLAQDDEPA
ncbi:MAG TPA: rhodanese-like domain-containing protein [Rhizobacter sp.]|nr:rhodanese-like domain-containing protein [Rhizobacter sp.]